MKKRAKKMKSIKAPWRYDVIGSFLRPAYLRQTRAALERGASSLEELKQVEDRAELSGYIDLLVDINNSMIASCKAGIVVNTHVCRGNYHSTFFSSGSYDSVAKPLFGRENVNAYLLEYDYG